MSRRPKCSVPRNFFTSSFRGRAQRGTRNPAPFADLQRLSVPAFSGTTLPAVTPYAVIPAKDAVIPAKAGIQLLATSTEKLDSGFRLRRPRNDGVEVIGTPSQATIQ